MYIRYFARQCETQTGSHGSVDFHVRFIQSGRATGLLVAMWAANSILERHMERLCGMEAAVELGQYEHGGVCE